MFCYCGHAWTSRPQNSGRESVKLDIYAKMITKIFQVQNQKLGKKMYSKERVFISTANLTNNTLIDKIDEKGIKVEKIIEAVLLIKRIDLKTPARIIVK